MNNNSHTTEKIVEVLQDRPNFTKFLQAIFRTNFWQILDGSGPFTVLAPTDEAFENFPKGSFEKLLNDLEELSIMIGQHVVIGRYWLHTLRMVDEIPTMANQLVAVEDHGEGFIVGGAKIIESDIECTNGVIHAIDLVLMP